MGIAPFSRYKGRGEGAESSTTLHVSHMYILEVLLHGEIAKGVATLIVEEKFLNFLIPDDQNSFLGRNILDNTDGSFFLSLSSPREAVHLLNK